MNPRSAQDQEVQVRRQEGRGALLVGGVLLLVLAALFGAGAVAGEGLALPALVLSVLAGLTGLALLLTWRELRCCP